ncbi:hypothetical protein B0H12DRAFT_1113884 [Mycena haematopus]|nr:hypothetical protein B0H12DRAFT_1155008 [Mycena haematopus]KAJ7255524.1 hypothetical protein B0H12DRAFT_1113884 [Mycena haematopus]
MAQSYSCHAATLLGGNQTRRASKHRTQVNRKAPCAAACRKLQLKIPKNASLETSYRVIHAGSRRFRITYL